MSVAPGSADLPAAVPDGEALRQSEQRLQMITSALGIGLIEHDFGSGETVVSEGCRALLGLLPGDVPATSQGWIDLLNPADNDEFHKGRARALDPAGDGWFTSEIFPSVRGETRAMEIRARVLFDRSGAEPRPERLIAILVDRTERNRLQQALSQAQRLETVGRLAGVMAHDFNNILTVILANLELAGLRTGDAAVRDLLDNAMAAAEMGASFNKRLLVLAGGRTERTVPLAIDGHIARTWDVFQRVLNEETELHFLPGAPGVIVDIDPGELDGAVLNLVVNARDAQPQGGRIVVTTSTVDLDGETARRLDGGRTGAFLCVAVADEGSGMPEEVARKAKEPFFSTKRPGRGTGLGLTSVALTAERAGGFVHIRTSPGAGTEVSVFLPYRTGPVAEAEPEDEQIPFGDGELVLVVEDDALVREAVLKRLEAIGYAVIEAENGQSALDLLDSGEPADLVFTDVVMPGDISGYDLIDEVRRNHPGIEVLLTSGYASKDHREAAGSRTEVALLAKPYTLNDLARAVARALGRAGRGDEA